MQFENYQTETFYDELFENSGRPRKSAAPLIDRIKAMAPGDLVRRQKAAETELLQMGITFTVYGNNDGTEKIFPFDIIPRIVPNPDWKAIEKGLIQRITALNLFIDDIYHDRKIVKDKTIPTEVILSSHGLKTQCQGLNPSKGIWIHITGTDLVRDKDGGYYVLEDNLRCPSGVSYVLENRNVLKRTLPQVFQNMAVKPVEDYPLRLLETLGHVSPSGVSKPRIVVLTPGPYNSAYFEHAFLAQQMGAELVEGRDLVVSGGYVKLRTTRGYERVDVIYRRVDDDFMDPQTFNGDSTLGVPGLFEVYKAGKVALANAIGTGIADDKGIYPYVPDMIRYYLKEDPVLPNVTTFVCWEEDQRKHVLQNLEKFVVKAVGQAGGYGMLVGPHSTKAEREKFAGLIQANPRNYIAQPTLSLSRVPVIVEDHFEGRHVDLRPYVLYGKNVYVLPGGLTRVALKKGSLVVNSSQGGGSKDTWVLEDPAKMPTGYGVEGPAV
ncbi:MAG TPA: circularly permuted type 2 ATP-grasp protein [bacterium]|nr:circularly permuted type 2 ATP-grasp protein [bacterium]